MSDNQANDSSAPDEQSGPKELREALQREKDARAELESQVQALTDAARSQAFAQAGVPEDKWGAAFRQTYEGPISVDEIQAKVDEWGVVLPTQAATPEVPLQQPVVSNPAFEALADIQAARDVGAPTPTGNDAVIDAMEKMRQDGSPDDLQAFLKQNGLLA